jgi:glycosyltransferase involved in cell wall biosynthesis
MSNRNQGSLGPPFIGDYANFHSEWAGARRPRPEAAVSVVTVCRNASTTIGRTIRSVQAQNSERVEHIIVDGLSDDGTPEVARPLLRPCDCLVSERDAGISDAMNKGVALARGAYVQFVPADDWLSEGQIREAVATLEATNADFVFGDVVFYERGVARFIYRGDPNYAEIIDCRMPSLNHPTVLARRTCFERIGLFDLRYRCAMDYDWFLRLHRAGQVGVYNPGIVGHMNHDGASNTHYRRTFAEVCDIAVRHGRAPWRASTEKAYQIAKVTAGRVLKARARPLYDIVRQGLNQSYRALG